MNKPFQNHNVRRFLRAAKPWSLALIFILALRFTGLLSGISVFTQAAIMKTGLMDFDPDKNPVREKSFNYNFTLKDLQGNTVDVSQFKGKVIFLNLWATWCGPCRAEMPSIQSLYNSVDHDKIAFLMISIDTPENFSKVTKYIADKNFSFPAFVPEGSLPVQLQVDLIPTTFIIGRDGKIKNKKTGTSNYDSDKFRDYLKQLVNETPEVSTKK